MPEGPLLTVSIEAARIKEQLDTYAVPRGGYCKVMANQRHLWEEIYVVSDSPRILICYMGENARGEYEGGQRTRMHRVDRKWTVVVMRGHGFKNLLTGEGLTGTQEDFYDSVETVRDGCRVMNNISEEFPVNYRSITPLPNVGPTQTANVFMDAYAIEFTTANDIPEITENGTTE